MIFSGIKTIFIHRFSGILSAYGLALADTVYEAQEPLGIQLTQGLSSVLMYLIVLFIYNPQILLFQSLILIFILIFFVNNLKSIKL